MIIVDRCVQSVLCLSGARNESYFSQTYFCLIFVTPFVHEMSLFAMVEFALALTLALALIPQVA